MSASLAAFIHQCLSEEKYGRQYVAEIEDRIESLNYAQLEGMHKVLTESASNARIDCWKSANLEILKHVEKWRKIKGDEHRRQQEFEAELLRKIREKERNRLREIYAKEQVINQLRRNARKDAEKEVTELEFNRKAEYRMELHELVPKAEARRSLLFKYAATCLVVGSAISIAAGILVNQPFVIVGGISVFILVSLFLVRKGVKDGRIAPFEETDVAKAIDDREEKLFLQSMDQLRQKDEDFKKRMQAEKEERRKRKAERREKEMARLALLAAANNESDDEDYYDDDDDDDDNARKSYNGGENEAIQETNILEIDAKSDMKSADSIADSKLSIFEFCSNLSSAADGRHQTAERDGVHLVSLNLFEINEKVVLKGSASVLIRLEDNNGTVRDEFETDFQKLSGDSLFWRFDDKNIYFQGCLSDESLQLRFQFITIQDGQRQHQAEFVLNKRDFDDCIKNTNEMIDNRYGKTENKKPCSLEGKMCRNGVVEICHIEAVVTFI